MPSLYFILSFFTNPSHSLTFFSIPCQEITSEVDVAAIAHRVAVDRAAFADICGDLLMELIGDRKRIELEAVSAARERDRQGLEGNAIDGALTDILGGDDEAGEREGVGRSVSRINRCN